MPTRRPGEAAGPKPNGDPLDLRPAELCVVEQPGGHRQQARRVPRMRARLRIVARLQRGAVGEPQPDDARLRRRVEAEHDHRSSTSICRRSAPRCASETSNRAPASSRSASGGHSTNAIRPAPR